MAVRLVARLTAGLLHRAVRVAALVLVAILELAATGLDPVVSDLAVVVLLATQVGTTLDLSQWMARLSAGVDSRLALVERCEAARRYAARPLDAEDLEEERVLRRRVIDAAAALDDLGPLGTVGLAPWDRWEGRRGPRPSGSSRSQRPLTD